MNFRLWLEYESGDYSFKMDRVDAALKFVPMLVDINKLDMALGAGQRIGPGGTGPNVKDSAYERFGQFVQTGEQIEMPSVDFDRSRVYLINGRHRLAWLRDRGLKQIWIAVRKNKFNKAQQMLT